jgi:hypothetical protein
LTSERIGKRTKTIKEKIGPKRGGAQRRPLEREKKVN